MRALLILVLFVGLAPAASVTLAWDANAASDMVDHYNIKWGFVMAQEDHVINVGNVTTYTVDEPWPIGATIYFVCTAVNTSTLESGPSNEVSFTVTPWNPMAPGHLKILGITK
jgi:hypothetical protein